MSLFKKKEKSPEEIAEESKARCDAMMERYKESEEESKNVIKELQEYTEREKTNSKGKLVSHLTFSYGAGQYKAKDTRITFGTVMKYFPEYRVVTVIEKKYHSFGGDDGGTYYMLFLEIKPDAERFYEAI